MYGLSVLPEVVEPRESSRAMTLERTFSSMLPDMPCKMLAPSETQLTRRKVGAEKALPFLLLRWSLRIACNAVVVRFIVVFRIISTLTHLDVTIVVCSRSSMRATALERLLRLGYGVFGIRGREWFVG